MQYNLPLDFILNFCREMINDHGEDSYCYSFGDTAGILGVFDGCGGAGARKHAYYSDKTEAYMASRLCAGAFYDKFRETYPSNLPVEKMADGLFGDTVKLRLSAFKPPREANDSGILGSMVRTLPTTAAVAYVQTAKGKDLQVSAMWAGDSRVYVLDANGLAQLTLDDTSVPDPMENSYEDGILKNIFCTDRKVKVNRNTLTLRPPFVLLAATDGCFGYVSTPMEFEGILLHSLLNSDNPAQWEEKLAELIGSSAGDDHTLCLASFGYNSFTALQKAFIKRYQYMVKKYLNPVSELPVEDRESRYAMWETYRKEYMRYLKDESA